jgi:uracil DNA glycosylase
MISHKIKKSRKKELSKEFNEPYFSKIQNFLQKEKSE